MTGKARVHELAKELGVTSKQVLVELERMGEHVRSASSLLEAPVARGVRERMRAPEAPRRVTRTFADEGLTNPAADLRRPTPRPDGSSGGAESAMSSGWRRAPTATGGASATPPPRVIPPWTVIDGPEAPVPGGPADGVPPEKRRRVFVVHGRDEAVKREMFHFLYSLDLRPLEWSEAVVMTGEGTPYPATVLDKALAETQAVVVLLTPDEQVGLRVEIAGPDDDTSVRFQARPNVLFEAGMAMAKSAERTILVQVGAHRSFSDIAGRHLLRMDGSVQKRHELVQRLLSAGCLPNTTGSHWIEAGTFAPP